MRTTLDLPDPLFREVKVRAAQSGLKLKELLTSYIEAGLRARPVPPNQLKREPLPTLRAPTGGAARCLSNAELQELMDKDDHENLTRAWSVSDKTP